VAAPAGKARRDREQPLCQLDLVAGDEIHQFDRRFRRRCATPTDGGLPTKRFCSTTPLDEPDDVIAVAQAA
jgi:hypothetical protein